MKTFDIQLHFDDGYIDQASLPFRLAVIFSITYDTHVPL